MSLLWLLPVVFIIIIVCIYGKHRLKFINPMVYGKFHIDGHFIHVFCQYFLVISNYFIKGIIPHILLFKMYCFKRQTTYHVSNAALWLLILSTIAVCSNLIDIAKLSSQNLQRWVSCSLNLFALSSP